jgi:hypothetical protein
MGLLGTPDRDADGRAPSPSSRWNCFGISGRGDDEHLGDPRYH